MIGYYLTHPQVEIDPETPVPQWSLSDKGRARLETILRRNWVRSLSRIVASDERKAVETATLLSQASSAPVETAADMGENDRSSTGFLAPEAFEAAADRFFAEPEESWNGWERAIDAADRVEAAVTRVLATHAPDRPILFAGHGAAGTLLKCRLAGRAIARSEDQPHGGGNVFAFRLADRSLMCDWTPMEDFHGC